MAGVAATRDGDPDSGLQALEKAAALAVPALQQLQNQQRPAAAGIGPGEALLFVAGKLQRNRDWAWDVQHEAERIAVRDIAVHALLSQGSVFQRQGKIQEAVAVVRQAASIDSRASAMLEALQAGSDEIRTRRT